MRRSHRRRLTRRKGEYRKYCPPRPAQTHYSSHAAAAVEINLEGDVGCSSSTVDSPAPNHVPVDPLLPSGSPSTSLLVSYQRAASGSPGTGSSPLPASPIQDSTFGTHVPMKSAITNSQNLRRAVPPGLTPRPASSPCALVDPTIPLSPLINDLKSHLRKIQNAKRKKPTFWKGQNGPTSANPSLCHGSPQPLKVCSTSGKVDHDYYQIRR